MPINDMKAQLEYATTHNCEAVMRYLTKPKMQDGASESTGLRTRRG